MSKSDWMFVAIIIGIILFYNIRRRWKNFRLKRKMDKARRAERKAVTFLERAGYSILEMQKRTTINTLVDGTPFENAVQADFIVLKDGKRYVVEVKTGQQATKITNSATRRQLLEYYFVYEPDGILLLDMEVGELKEVNFQIRRPFTSNWESTLVKLIIAFGLGMLTFALLSKGGFGT